MDDPLLERMLDEVCGDDTDVGGADAMSPGSSQGALRPGWPHSNIALYTRYRGGRQPRYWKLKLSLDNKRYTIEARKRSKELKM